MTSSLRIDSLSILDRVVTNAVMTALWRVPIQDWPKNVRESYELILELCTDQALSYEYERDRINCEIEGINQDDQ